MSRATLTSLELRKAIRDKFAFPGGYEIAGVTSDGALLCCDCMRKEYRNIASARRDNRSDGWRVEALTTSAVMEDFETCDHCAHWLDGYHEEGAQS